MQAENFVAPNNLVVHCQIGENGVWIAPVTRQVREAVEDTGVKVFTFGVDGFERVKIDWAIWDEEAQTGGYAVNIVSRDKANAIRQELLDKGFRQ